LGKHSEIEANEQLMMWQKQTKKRATPPKLQKQPYGMPPPRPIHPKERAVYELSNDEIFSLGRNVKTSIIFHLFQGQLLILVFKVQGDTMMSILLHCGLVNHVLPLWTSKYLQWQDHWLSFPTTSTTMYFDTTTHIVPHGKIQQNNHHIYSYSNMILK